MSEEQLKNMYDRTNKLLNGENKDTYGFSPAEIQQLIKETQLLKSQLQQKENIIKEVREYVENNWINQKDADNRRFDDEELDIEISDIAVLFDILDKDIKKKPDYNYGKVEKQNKQ